ncbi:Hypothetical predicted protein [Podarcis lilfordi]|uniref:Uncharacterized protein n=1 Tax=Podarcis lilfordi TaxID=74358 RepID=A0AA35P2S5_9SAUR|nr:Hypothetical predicted protein [Podarcis lilfordi]
MAGQEEIAQSKGRRSLAKILERGSCSQSKVDVLRKRCPRYSVKSIKANALLPLPKSTDSEPSPFKVKVVEMKALLKLKGKNSSSSTSSASKSDLGRHITMKQGEPQKQGNCSQVGVEKAGISQEQTKSSDGERERETSSGAPQGSADSFLVSQTLWTLEIILLRHYLLRCRDLHRIPSVISP